MDGIRELDFIAQGRVLIGGEGLRKEDMSKELVRIILLEEVSWRQKFFLISKKIWIISRVMRVILAQGPC
jgi:hypothetical protein